jgi:membrane associated rhomboid family serine protease
VRVTRSEPIFNVPAVVFAIIALFALIRAGEEFLLPTEGDLDDFLRYFAFIPARYDASPSPSDALPRGVGVQIWTFVTYALIHGDLIHLGVNSAWFLPFGSALARRFGTLRFIGFFIVTSAAGALLHLFAHAGEPLPMIGSSAAVSGCMAGAIRFAFQEGGPLVMFRSGDDAAYRVPAAPLAAALRDLRILIFLMAWFGFNFLFGLGIISVLGVEQSIAWEAHIGGFLAGFVLFSFFDPTRSQSI